MRSLPPLVRGVALAVAVGLGVYAIVAQWGDIALALGRVGVVAPLLALLSVLAGLGASAMSWRALLVAFGERLPLSLALRVFFVGQLGKYVPGGVWPVLAQMELGRAEGARRQRVATVALVVLAVNVTTGLVVAVAGLPLTSAHALHRAWWALTALPVGLVALHPRVLTALVNGSLRLVRRGELAQPLTGRAVLGASLWSIVMWLLYGVQTFVLVRPLAEPGDRLLALATGAYALAWVVGFLVVVAPAGIGAREGMLVVALAPAMTASAATTVAVVSRLVMTGGDLAWAAAAGAASRRARHRRLRPDVPGNAASRG